MKLHFHGGDYEYHSSKVETKERKIGGTYRGVPCNITKYQVQNRHRQRSLELTYRGTHYTIN
jgi:hypothetical protein